MTIDLRQPSGEPIVADDLPIVKAIASHEITRGREVIGRRPDDSLVPLLVSAAPIVAADGKLAGAAMVVQDITALKQLEHLREEWASIVAHDLRQPISVISLRSSLLLRGVVGDAQREDIRQIRAAAESLSRMASDLMDASLVDTRRMHVTLERLDLGRLMEDVIERVPPAARRTKARTPPDVRLFVKADAHRLEQVVANLLLNAVKYGAPRTEIGLDLTHADGEAEIIVTNRGPGIPSNDLAFVFERFARSRPEQVSTTKGLGLGLYIAKGLVEAHGGRIWAESVPDGVTAFHVTLPLDGPPVPAEALVVAAQGAR
jgi:signal transduction histidine kinase